MSFLGSIFGGALHLAEALPGVGGLVKTGADLLGVGGSAPAPSPVPIGALPSLPSLPGYSGPTRGIDINLPYSGAPGAGINFLSPGGTTGFGVNQVPATTGGDLPPGTPGGMISKRGIRCSPGYRVGANGYCQPSGQSMPILGPVQVAPKVVGTIQRKDGTVSQIHRCPRGMVLAKDMLCYPKSMVPKKFREWKPAKKPPISVRDWDALKRAKRAKNRAESVAREAGLYVRKTRRKS